MRRQFLHDVVEPPEVVLPVAIGGGDGGGCRVRGDAVCFSQATRAGLRRCGHQHAHDVGSACQRHRGGVRNDDRVALARDLVDRGLDQDAEIIRARAMALVRRQAGERGRAEGGASGSQRARR